MSTATLDKGRIRELRSALREKVAEIEGLSGDWKIEGKTVDVGDRAKYDLYVKAVNDAEEIKGLIVAEQKAAGMLSFLDAPAGMSAAGADAAGQAGEYARVQRAEVKGLGSRLIESESFAEMKARRNTLGVGVHGSLTVDGVDLFSLAQHAAMEGKDVYSQMAGSMPEVPVLGQAQNLGITDRPLRQTRIRDLFPRDTTTAAVLYGVRQTGFINNARPVPQREVETLADGSRREVFGRKPKSDLTLATVTYPIATIAHTLDAHKNVLDDEPRLRRLLDRDMIDGVKMAEDHELLYGDGIGENITGLVNTQGIQGYRQVAGDRKSAAIRRAATRAALAQFTPTGVVMHEFDWEDIELETDANGNYVVAVSVAVGGEKRLWRMDVVATPAIYEGRFLLGSFGNAAKLYDREQVGVTVSTENRDNYERNVITLRAEERLALEVSRPEAFVYGTFEDAFDDAVTPA